MSRIRALRLYRQIIRTGKQWKVPTEQEYILNETRTLFRKNKSLTSQKEIDEKIFEGQSRLELGLHYQIPYPRLYNAPAGATPDHLKEGMASKNKSYTSAYMDSLY